MNLADAAEASPYSAALSTRFALAAYHISAYGEDCLGICLISHYVGDHIVCGSPKTIHYPIPDNIRMHAHLPLNQLPPGVRARVESDEGKWEPATQPRFQLEDAAKETPNGP